MAIEKAEVLQPGKVDDIMILRCIDKHLEPWDPGKFEVVATLQSCPRNAGQVRLVQERSTGRRLAVKRMPLSWTCKDADAFRFTYPSETEVPWMDMAATRWLNLVGFQHCIDFRGVFRDEDYIAFVMGLAEGGDLFSFVDAMGLPVPGPALEEALQPIAVEFLFAVARLHRLGLAHRDLSLENVLLANKKGGPVYLIDYSMATTKRFHTGPACGKASYIAPEMHLGDYDAFQADVFSCGVILYALFAKDYPWISTRAGACKCFEYVRTHGFLKFMSKRRIIVGNDKKPVQQVMSPSFTQLLDGLLRFKPEDRLVLLEAQPGLSSSSVWAQPWLRQAVEKSPELLSWLREERII
ncbi:Calcium-dependent protein kinase 1 (OsCDPK1) (OsCPK1) [Durusdinium trenchii]|uniref:Calcium-dependent protein kinase 1 (OsCDPK1) (OsCPK1) n=1 Tax=Durusdinium trenchii TaxID=1381693 RepID=A0ABP0S899_9DINO